eukprot:gene288-1492_t
MAPLALWLPVAASAADMWSVRIYDTAATFNGWPCYGGVQGRWAAPAMGACAPPPVKGWPSLRVDDCSGMTTPFGAGWMRGIFFRDDGCTEPINTSTHNYPNWLGSWHIKGLAGGVQFGFKNPDLSVNYDPF